MTFTEPYFNFKDFYSQMAKEPFRNYVELGVHTGASIAFLAQRLEETGRPFDLFGVDLWQWHDTEGEDPFNVMMARFDSLGINCVRPIRMSTLKAAEMWPDQSVDFVFIDASHDYESVKADIIAWRPKIKPGGIISGHDYGEPCGVQQAVDELVPGASITGTVWWKRI